MALQEEKVDEEWAEVWSNPNCYCKSAQAADETDTKHTSSVAGASQIVSKMAAWHWSQFGASSMNIACKGLCLKYSEFTTGQGEPVSRSGGTVRGTLQSTGLRAVVQLQLRNQYRHAVMFRARLKLSQRS